MSDTTIPRPLIAAGEIAVNNVSKNYGSGHLTKEVVRDCNFTIERGKLTVMIGPSGCGKSTLIRLLAGFEQPSSGMDRIDAGLLERHPEQRIGVEQPDPQRVVGRVERSSTGRRQLREQSLKITTYDSAGTGGLLVGARARAQGIREGEGTRRSDPDSSAPCDGEIQPRRNEA